MPTCQSQSAFLMNANIKLYFVELLVYQLQNDVTVLQTKHDDDTQIANTVYIFLNSNTKCKCSILFGIIYTHMHLLHSIWLVNMMHFFKAYNVSA